MGGGSIPAPGDVALTIEEQRTFDAELKKIEPERQERVMEIVTSWMEQGIEQGVLQGKQNEARSLVLRILRKRLGSLESDAEARVDGLSVEQLEQLAEAVLDFSSQSDLTRWLDANAQAE